MKQVLFCVYLLANSYCLLAQSGQADWLHTIHMNAVTAGKWRPPKVPHGFALYFTEAGNIMVPYLVYVPSSYDPANEMPAVVFLHGAILARDSFQYKDPAIADEPIFSVAELYHTLVIFPFGRSDFMWPNQRAANENILKIVEQVEQHYNVDKKRVYLGGISMGGSGTWWFINNHPEGFAGFYAFSSMPRGATKYENITASRPLYSMNAKDDRGISYSEAATLYEQHKKEAPGWHFSSVETGGHRFIYEGEKGKEITKELLGNFFR